MNEQFQPIPLATDTNPAPEDEEGPMGAEVFDYPEELPIETPKVEERVERIQSILNPAVATAGPNMADGNPEDGSEPTARYEMTPEEEAFVERVQDMTQEEATIFDICATAAYNLIRAQFERQTDGIVDPNTGQMISAKNVILSPFGLNPWLMTAGKLYERVSDRFEFDSSEDSDETGTS